MTSINSLTLQVDDPDSAARFYRDAFGLGPRLHVVRGTEASSGFRAFTISLLVAQPADACALLDAALGAGATTLKPATKSMWGFGGVVQAPDGTIWKVATSAKKDTRAASTNVDSIVVLLGSEDVAASKRFYADHGLQVVKSFGGRYVEFDLDDSPIKLALYRRRALAKDAGVDPDGSGAHRIVIDTDGASFTDPDGFPWAAAA